MSQDITPKLSAQYDKGAIVARSWGHERGHVSFYVIAKLGETFATLLPLQSIPGANGWAVPNGIDPKGRPVRKKLFYDRHGEPVGFVFDRTLAQLWDGRPERFTPRTIKRASWRSRRASPPPRRVF